MTSTTANQPALVKGGGFRDYRLYTRDHVTFDDVLAERERTGRRGLVVIDKATISTSSLMAFLSSPEVVAENDGLITLNATYRVVHADQGVSYVKHPLDGTKYATKVDADRACFEAGLLAHMVYEK